MTMKYNTYNSIKM